jgi:hypothetical protein
MARHIFSDEVKLVAGQTSPEDALSTVEYPASASRVDVRGYEWVNCIVHFGAIHASDVPVLELKSASTVSASLTSIDTTNCKHTAAATDDDEVVSFYLETANMATDQNFVSLDVSGVSNGSYGDIMFFLGGARHKPVTQTTALLPAASQKILAG